MHILRGLRYVSVAVVLGVIGSPNRVTAQAETTEAQGSSPFLFNLGANFDFIDGLKTNDLYYEFRWASHDVWRIKGLPVSIAIGIAQARGFTTPPDTALSSARLRMRRDTLPSSDTTSAVGPLVQATASTRLAVPSVLNLFTAIDVEVGSNVFLSTLFDVRKRDQREVTATRVVTVQSSGSGQPPDTIGLTVDTLRSTLIEYESFVGVGPQIHFDTEEVEVGVKAIFGVRWVSRLSNQDDGDVRIRRSTRSGSTVVPTTAADGDKRRAGYVLQLRLVEKQRVGFQLGWEMRNRPDRPRDFYFHLSKTISIAKLAELLVACNG